MKKRLILFIVLMIAGDTFAQTNYRNLLVRNNRTYWATNESICESTWKWQTLYTGVCFDPNGIFDWYEISYDNDTLSSYDLQDTEFFVSHRTYELKTDTIFITSWHKFTGEGQVDEAYKILYLTEQTLVLLKLAPKGSDGWADEVQIEDCRWSTVLNLKYLKPQEESESAEIIMK